MADGIDGWNEGVMFILVLVCMYLLDAHTRV